MKKILMILCVLFSVFGCSCKKDERVTLKKEKMPEASQISVHLYSQFSLVSYELDSADYDEKINNKDSFLLFVYRENCYGCGLLAPALKNYVDENDVTIYTIAINNITEHSLYTEEGITETPYLIIIQDGEIVKKEIATLTNNAESNKEWVSNWMNENIIWEA